MICGKPTKYLRKVVRLLYMKKRILSSVIDINTTKKMWFYIDILNSVLETAQSKKVSIIYKIKMVKGEKQKNEKTKNKGEKK